MQVYRFLWSRLPFVATYTGFLAITIIIIQLDLWLSRTGLRTDTILYLVLLGLVGLAIWLLFDYQRWARYLQRLANLHAETIDQLGTPPIARTYEQAAFTQAWSELYSRLTAEAIDERHKGQRNIKLVSQWAHHMKTPVSIIDLELQKADKLSPSPEIREVLASINEENKRLHHALQSLLNMTRLEEFSADFRIEPVDLGEMVRRLINDYKRSFIAHQVYPKVDWEQFNTAVVHSDAKWLRFILEQLLNNAIKYSADLPREGQVVFRCFRDGADTVLEIADNGIGIAPEDLDRVFQPFFTGHNGRAYPQSTGIGLYLVREACLQLGHDIRIAAQPDAGTQVQVRFPASRTIHAGLQTTDINVTKV